MKCRRTFVMPVVVLIVAYRGLTTCHAKKDPSTAGGRKIVKLGSSLVFNMLVNILPCMAAHRRSTHAMIRCTPEHVLPDLEIPNYETEMIVGNVLPL